MDRKKFHAVCIPLPAQGHINPMLKLAKLLHHKGFHITFVHTEFNYNKLIDPNNPSSMQETYGFRFETVSDGLPPSNQRGILDLPDLCVTLPIHCKKSFKELLLRLKESCTQDVPPVTCVISDGVMSFTMEVAKELGIPEVLFFTPSACAMLGYLQFEEVVKRGYFPLKDASCLTNGFLDTELDWIPGINGFRLKDLPTFFRSTDPNDLMFNYNLESAKNAMKSGTIILNTFQDLEQEVLDTIRNNYLNVYTIGPLSMLHQHLCIEDKLGSIDSSLWKQDLGCLEWLDKRAPSSVVYVNFGSLITMTTQQLSEFAWGLANSKYYFLWVIRPNLVNGGNDVISHDFLEEIKDRGMIMDWCPQEKVLGHISIGGFLTHCGWNSILESICVGVPMICWPFFADQQVNSLYLCTKWGIGMEIDTNVKRDEVEGLVRELMDGSNGRKMKENVKELKKLAEMAISPGGTSYGDFCMLIKYLKGEESW